MSKIILKATLRYVPEGQVYPVDIPAGTEVVGRAAELAKATGIAEELTAEAPAGSAPSRRAKASSAAPETK